jgi:hypothetical protein
MPLGVNELTPAEAAKFKLILERQFLWIGADEPVNGGDVLQEVVDLHEALARQSRTESELDRATRRAPQKETI